MSPANPPTQAPTAAELLADPVVQSAMQQAWIDSQISDAAHRHEEGGWIYMDTTTGNITTQRAPTGTRARLDLSNPPRISGSVVVGTFHTHPNPTAEGWNPRPSSKDQASSALSGVPWLILSDQGNFTCGPNSRRGGLTGNPGYPA